MTPRRTNRIDLQTKIMFALPAKLTKDRINALIQHIEECAKSYLSTNRLIIKKVITEVTYQELDKS